MGTSRRLLMRALVVSSMVVAFLLPALTAVPTRPAHAAARVANRAASASEVSKVTLGDTSVDGPALWTSNPASPNLGLASVLAWTGTDASRSLNVLLSSDGTHYGGKITFGESSATRPAGVALGPPTTLVLAWTGTDAAHHLNLLCQGLACGTSGSGYKKLTLTADTSFTSPALARFGNGLALAWAGVDTNHSLNIWPFSLNTAGSGFVMGSKTILSQFRSTAQPSLSVNSQNNTLLLAWSAASPANELAVATSSNATSWSAVTLVSETSAAGPTGYAVGTSSMPPFWVAWTGTDANHSLNVRFSPDSTSWPPSDKTTFTDTAFGGPGIGYVGDVGQMLLAWTGTDAAHHLNVATLASNTTPTLDQRIDSYLAGLSTTQLIGQTIMMAICTDSFAADSANLTQALKTWDVGSAIIYTTCNGSSTPHPPAPASNLQQLAHDLQANADRSGTLLLGTDQEGGTVDRLAPYFGSTPSARALANTGNPQNAYNQAQTDAGRLRSVGLNADFAPVVDVDQGGGEGSARMFGTTVGTVVTYGGAFLAGLQQNGVAGTLKHWPGIGAATGNPDLTLPTISSSQAVLQATDFAPFAALLYQAPGMIMVTTVLVPAFDAQRPADLSPTLVNSLLRSQIGYQGIVITDALGAQSIVIYMQQQGFTGAAAIGEAAVRAFLAGDDLLLCPLAQSDLQAVVSAMTSDVSSGRITQAELHTAVHRIIRLKVELGLVTV